MSRGATFRGQPLLLLGAVLLGWVTLRVAFWQSPWPEEPAAALVPANYGAAPARVGEAPPDRGTGTDAAGVGDGAPAAAGEGGWTRRPLPPAVPSAASQAAPINPAWSQLPALAPVEQPPVAPPASGASAAASPPAAPASGRRSTVRAALGHSMLMLAGLSEMELPSGLLAALQGGVPSPPPSLARASAGQGRAEATLGPAGIVPNRSGTSGSRWTADAWVLLREDSNPPPFIGASGYGRSQAGAVLRYRLAPGSGRAPQAHLRASAALDNGGSDLRDRELAAGISARPIPSVPIRVAAEARLSDSGRGTSVRPAVYAVTELNPAPLPLGARAELYLQGGYVGGDFETGFVDGQARVERPVGRLGSADVSAGAAVWGGAQRGASRLDVGPSAAVSLSLGRLRGRLAADYRFRIAGESRPASGPALTLYAGF